MGLRKQRNYYLPEGVPLIRRKYKEWFQSCRPVPRFPRKLQIQTITGCNARCAFCPSGRTKLRIPDLTIDDDLYRKIIDEALRHEVTRISPFLMNEPFSDRELGWKVRYIADRKPAKLTIKINSNASLLDEEMSRQVLDSGLDRLNISFHGISKEVYRTSMFGLDRDETLCRIDHFLEMKERGGHEKPLVAITMVRTKAVEAEEAEIRRYWGDRGIGVNIRPLENRTRESIQNKGLNPGEWHSYSWCRRLFENAYVLSNGDMVLCCADWERTTVLGNVAESSIEEVWNGEKAVSIRESFIAGRLEGTLCENCLKQTR